MHFILIASFFLLSSAHAIELTKQKTFTQNSVENLFIENDYQQICLHLNEQLSPIFNKETSLNGDIARIYFFCEAQYNYQLTRKQRRSFEIWDIKDPVNQVECDREVRLKNQAKETNSYIINRCRL